MTETEFELLKQEVQHIDGQFKRFVSHLESEQRVYNGHRALIDYNKTMLDIHQKSLEKHEAILINSGRGLLFDVDRLKQRAESSKSNIALWISIISAAAAIISIVLR
jgi:phosphoglycerate dehydrogenase-like enzyme